MDFKKFTSLSLLDTEKFLNTNFSNGLSQKKSKELQKTIGINELENKKIGAFIIFFRQFKSSFIYLLFGASITSFIFGEKFDAIFIFSFIVINIVLSFIQEYKSSKTIEILNKHLSPICRVKRFGKFISMESKFLVPGDIVVLEAGDIVPADVKIISDSNFYVNESILTGESIDIRKDCEIIKNNIKHFFEATNICFSGTNVKSGKAECVVIATGKNTEVGKIAKLSSEVEDKSIFKQETDKISKFVLIIVSITLGLLILSKLILNNGENFVQIMVFAVALAVSAIPESLPAVVTFSLSKGAYVLAKNKVIIKRLSSVEDIGSIEILCTDKTGTITKNDMTISDSYYPYVDKETYLKYLSLSCSFDIKKKTVNNSFDLAIFKIINLKHKKNVFDSIRLKEFPFDPQRKKNSVLIKNKNKNILIVKGAPEEILNACNISNLEKNKILNLHTKYGIEGKRSIALAIKETDKNTYSKDDENCNLKFISLTAFEDPIKESTIPAVKKAKKKGVVIKIITGDGVEVAGAVGKKIGIIKNHENVITGNMIDEIEDEKELEKICKENNVFARCTPLHKYKIIKILKQNNRVAFLGEGINDAPALKVAHVGIVVKDASDIARDSADIILLNKSLSIIIDGIEQGRSIVVNISKYIKATLTSNFGNFYAIVISTFFIEFLPMLPIQILLLNLLSDFPMMSIATDKVDNEETQYPTKFDIKKFASSATILGLVSTAFDLIFFFTFLPYGEKTLQTAWFIGSVLTELLLIYSIRTNKIFYKAKSPSSIIVAFTIIASLSTLLLPLIGIEKLGFVKFGIKTYLIIIFIAIGYFACTEIAKIFYNKSFKKYKTKNI